MPAASYRCSANEIVVFHRERILPILRSLKIQVLCGLCSSDDRSSKLKRLQGQTIGDSTTRQQQLIAMAFENKNNT